VFEQPAEMIAFVMAEAALQVWFGFALLLILSVLLFHCPFCGRLQLTFQKFLKTYLLL